MIIEFVFELSHDGIGVIDVVGVSVGVAVRLGSFFGFFGLFSRRCLQKMSILELEGKCKTAIPANSLKSGLKGAF